MASPQRENGATIIANEIMAKLCSLPLSGREFRMIFLVIRKTYGFQKKFDWISLSQFVKELLMDRPSICRVRNSLVKKRILKEEGKNIGFNKNWEDWLIAEEGNPVALKGNRLVAWKAIGGVPRKAHTKESITKETLQKGKPISKDDFYRMAYRP